jgi:hypothetical protein
MHVCTLLRRSKAVVSYVVFTLSSRYCIVAKSDFLNSPLAQSESVLRLPIQMSMSTDRYQHTRCRTNSIIRYTQVTIVSNTRRSKARPGFLGETNAFISRYIHFLKQHLHRTNRLIYSLMVMLRESKNKPTPVRMLM